MTDLSPEEAAVYHEAMKQEYPLLNYKPSPTQLEVHRDCTPNKAIVGGSRSGKTLCSAVEITWLATKSHPYKENAKEPLSILVLCLTRQQASQVFQRKLMEDCEMTGFGGKPLLPKAEIADAVAMRVGFPVFYRITLRDGTIMEFAWSDDPASFVKVQGSKRHLIYVDEAICTRKLLIELRKRVADARSMAIRGEAPAWYGTLMFGATGTEDSEGFEAFLNDCENPQMPDHKLFRLKPGETGAIDQQVIASLRATMTEEEQAIHIDGTATAGGLQRIYHEFNEERHLLATDYEPKPSDNLWFCYDPGTTHPTGMFVGCIRPEKPFQKLVVRCWKHQYKKFEFDVACLVHYLRGRALAGVIYDWNAGGAAGKQSEVNLIDAIKQEFQKQNIQVLGGWFRSKKANDKGIPAVKAHLDPDHYNPNAEPRLMLNPSPESGCRLMAIEFRKYKGRPETKFTGINGVVKKNDDLMDPLKYWCAEGIATQWQQGLACGGVIYQPAPVDQRLAEVNVPPAPKTPHDLLLERAAAQRGVRRGGWMRYR